MPIFGDVNLEIGREIANRFSIAKNKLKEQGEYKTEVEFAENVCTDRRNLKTILENENRLIGLYTLAHLSAKYHIDAKWLFIGQGDIFSTNKTKVLLSKDRITLQKEIVSRFVEFIKYLTDNGIVSSINAFADEVKYPSQHIYHLKNGKDTNVPFVLCKHMISRYRLNAFWLLTGSGLMAK